MEALIFVAAPIAIVMVLSLVKSFRPTPPPPPPVDEPLSGKPATPGATTEETEAPPMFRVLALGPSGSGKTVFLSSLFHELNYQAPERSYHLETNAKQRLELSSIYGAVSDTSKPFPAGTTVGESRDFVFDCVARDEHRNRHRVLRMCYSDYAGELLEGCGNDSKALEDLVERIHSADALLGMIDGHRVLQLLRGERAGHNYFQHTLQPMFGFMQEATCPIHLVLTKWDLVHDFGEPGDADDAHRLDCVIEALTRYPHIRSLVYVHSSGQIVRLIPVSAVGSDFAELGSNGMVRKRSDGELHPTNVEVPLCAVLPDVFKQIEQSLDDKARAKLDAELKRNIRGDMRAIAVSMLSMPAAAVARITLQGYGAEASALFVESVARQPLHQKGRRLVEARNEAERNIAVQRRLRGAVMSDFTRRVMQLEAVLPKSELSRRW